MIAIVDTETTGLPSQPWARIMEIAAVAIGPNGHYLGDFSRLVMPDPLDDRADPALRRSGIDKLELALAPRLADVLPDFMRWVENYNIEAVWSYNRAFDRSMLEREGVYLPWKGCVMRLARQHMPPRQKDPSLVDACVHYRISMSTQHRALPDARAAAELFCRLRPR